MIGSSEMVPIIDAIFAVVLLACAVGITFFVWNMIR